jgi:hypothetical protein
MVKNGWWLVSDVNTIIRNKKACDFFEVTGFSCMVTAVNNLHYKHHVCITRQWPFVFCQQSFKGVNLCSEFVLGGNNPLFFFSFQLLFQDLQTL